MSVFMCDMYLKYVGFSSEAWSCVLTHVWHWIVCIYVYNKLVCWQCIQVIDKSYEVAQQLLNDVDLHLLVHDAYGKGFMKSCKMGPDAYIQIVLQLAYYRVRINIELFHYAIYWHSSLLAC